MSKEVSNFPGSDVFEMCLTNESSTSKTTSRFVSFQKVKFITRESNWGNISDCLCSLDPTTKNLGFIRV